MTHFRRRRHVGVTANGAVNSMTTRNPMREMTKNSSGESDPRSDSTSSEASSQAMFPITNCSRRRVGMG